MLLESDRDEIIYIVKKVLKASGIITVVIPKDVGELMNLDDERFTRDPAKTLALN